MRTHVEFTSDAFPPYPGEEESINPGIWGKRLAGYLIDKLAERGIATAEPYAEDWGWEIPVKNEGFSMFIGCSNQLEQNGNRFLCFIEPSKPKVRVGLFRTVSTVAAIGRVAGAMEAILQEHPAIRDIRWWDDSEK